MTIRIDKNVLGGNAIQTVSGTAPASPITGALWYDTGAAALKVWTGSAWAAAVAPPVTSVADTATVDLTLSGGVLTGAVVNGSIGPTQLSFDPATQAELDAVASAAALTAGAGLTKTGSTLDVGAGMGLTVAADTVGLTVPVPVSYGGTGQTTLPSWGVLLGHSSSPITGVRASADDQVLTSLDGVDPVFGQVNLASPNAVKGTLPPARMGSGTPSATTYLRGDSTWATPAGGGGGGTDTHTVATSPPASPVAGDVWLDTTAVAADMVTQAELDAYKAIVGATLYTYRSSDLAVTAATPVTYASLALPQGSWLVEASAAVTQGGAAGLIDCYFDGYGFPGSVYLAASQKGVWHTAMLYVTVGAGGVTLNVRTYSPVAHTVTALGGYAGFSSVSGMRAVRVG